MNKKRKKNQRLDSNVFVSFGEKKVSIEELTDEINKMDKAYGIKLKHPEIWREPDQYKQIVEANAEMAIAALMCTVNGIKIEDYFETDQSPCHFGTICRPIGVEHQDFTDESKLNWNDDKTCYDMKSIMFRCRFMTFTFMRFIGRLDKITEREARVRYKMKHSISEKQIMLMKSITEDCIRFAKLMVNPGNKYQNSILKMNEHISYSKKKCNHRELQTLLNGHIQNTRAAMKKDPFTKERFADDDMAIYQTLKIAYMLATGKTNVGCIPKFKYIENATVKHDLLKLIEALGEAIITNTTDMLSLSPMFNAFILARPKVWVEYGKECRDNLAVRMGCLALAYSKFVYDDRIMDRFIDKMMKRGI